MKRLVVLCLAAAAFGASAQRVITPVKTDDKKPAEKQLYYYDLHGEPLKEPVRFLAELDTVTNVKSGPVYPLLNGLTIGANFFDAILMATGQKYASFDVSADISLHNWFFPVAEVGVGFAKNTPEHGNFTYKGLPSIYAKVGINYNFLYKSNPAYQFFFGLRFGFSSFSYDVTDITIKSDYWGQTNTFDLPRQHATAMFGEALIGLRVKIFGPISMGWTARFHGKFGTPKGEQSQPWFIPGYGAKSPLAATFSISYSLGWPKSKMKEKKPEPDSIDASLLPPPPAEETAEPETTESEDASRELQGG